LTISIGVACKENKSEDTLEAILENADQALLLAKQNGRNRVEVWHNKDENLL
jgi:diguanylate cyclase (GGDEF)-like protein